MEIITKEDYRSFRIVAIFLMLTGAWVGTMGLVQHNPNSFILGSSFTTLSILAFMAILSRKLFLAKKIWGFGTPALILLAGWVVPVQTSSIIVTYGDALIGGCAFVYYAYSEKEKMAALWSVLFFTAALFSYDQLIYYSAAHPEEMDFYMKYYSHMKMNQLLHHLSIVYLVYIVRKNKFRIQSQLSEQIERLRLFTERLISISKDETLYGGLLEESVHEIAKYTSQIAGVSRVSVWKYDESRNSIYYVSGYNSATHEGFASRELNLSDYPEYTSHLLTEKIIRVDNALGDLITKDLQIYLKQNGILSMMDCPVFVEGKFVGILCCEEQRTYRTWDEVDQLFCQAMAQLVSIAYYSAARSEHYNEVMLLNNKLVERNKVLHEVNEMVKAGTKSSDMHIQGFMSDVESLKEILGEYSYKNSHQIRGPLSRILGLVGLYKKDDSIDNRRFYIEHIERSANEMDEIIKEITKILNMGK